MNEKIKELWNKTCGEIQPEMDGICMTNQRGQKFAELIVRECLGMIENEATQYAEPVWAFELVNDIKEHFGVKE
jgi:hypothetical protein